VCNYVSTYSSAWMVVVVQFSELAVPETNARSKRSQTTKIRWLPDMRM